MNREYHLILNENPIAQSQDAGRHVVSVSRVRQPNRVVQQASEAASSSAPPRANQREDGVVEFVLPDCGLRCTADGHVYAATMHAPLGQSCDICF